MIDNLAQFKRAMTLGSCWESIYLLNRNEEPKIRVVTQVQTNGVTCLCPIATKTALCNLARQQSTTS